MNRDGNQAPDSRPKAARGAESMGGLAKGLAIIESFTPARPRLTVSEAAASSNTTPAAARRCLLTLEELGYVDYDGKFFRPTPRMMRLSAAYSEVDSLPVLAQPLLVSVREAFDESSSLSVLDGADVFFVARSESSHTASTGMRVGARRPAVQTAAGRVLLAALGDDEVSALLDGFTPVRMTDGTTLTVLAARDRIRQAGELGYSFTDEDLEIGVRAIAVPVIDSSGTTAAAMSISALSARFSMEVMRERFLPVLFEHAARLGAKL